MNRVHEDRLYWLEVMEKIAYPILFHSSQKQLKAHMPVEQSGEDNRECFTHLEALGRLLSGIAPWLESGINTGKEGELRRKYADWARKAIDAGTDPESPDYMNFHDNSNPHPIVDASHLALAILRAPTELWEKLDDRVKRNVVSCLKASRRSQKPYMCNWLLFAALTEVAFMRMGEDWDSMRIDFALKQHEQWYLGDGVYSDGFEFHWDYYNSFVIHPFLVEIMDNVANQFPDWLSLRETIIQRAKRFASIQERLIAPDGSFPPIGRSLTYRFGAFHLLAQFALRKQLDEHLIPAQVRCALTAVMRKIIDAPGTFDENGWLTIGLCGHQPELGEHYISTGSLYICAAVFLPLGLSVDDPFWQGQVDWTSKKVWSGRPIPIDKALREKK